MPDDDLELDTAIERIVEGGLTPEGLRNAMAKVAAAHGGWERCTFAFLEARYWAEALRDAGHPSVSLPEKPHRPRLRFRPALAAGIAAAVCFAAGWLAGGRVGRPVGGAVQVATPSVPDVTQPQAAVRESPTVDELVREVGRLQVGTGQGGAPAAVVPVFGGPGLDPSWVMNQPMPVSDREQADLARRGFRLEQSRRIVEVPLSDGRRVILPVDQVRVRGAAPYPL